MQVAFLNEIATFDLSLLRQKKQHSLQQASVTNQGSHACASPQIEFRDSDLHQNKTVCIIVIGTVEATFCRNLQHI